VTNTGADWAQSGLAMAKRQASRLARKQQVREECVDKDSKDKDEDERGMTTPWRGRMWWGWNSNYYYFLLV
jgi:hypothetical protein